MAKPNLSVAGTMNRPLALVSLGACLLAGCASLGGSGPSAGDVRAVARQIDSPITILPLDAQSAARSVSAGRPGLISETLGDGVPFGALIGRGDVLDVSIWEAPPAALFGSASADSRLSSSGSTARGTALPEQMVDPSGRISVPFVGSLPVEGRSVSQVERDIVSRLNGLAHQPQAIVRLVRNATAAVTVVGDVTSSIRMPLTPKGERLLDALATAGGTRQPVGKTTIRVSRGARVASLPLEQIISDPAQNIRLQADDVVTALYQPYSFTALGALTTNAEIPFEATGLSLAQALGRVGGLRDDRANVRGVFIFRLEVPAALDESLRKTAHMTAEGLIPVVYVVDMKDPATFILAQDFPIRNKDVLYVSNAPVAEIQKFVNIVSAMTFSVVGIRSTF